jgi:Domain of unknown function (DUF4136)
MARTRFATLLAPALALMMLGGCASGFNANVSRFQQLPPVQGQSFTVVADDPRLAGSLEFAHYASLVAQKLGAQGYSPSADPASAALIVRLRYDVDKGKEKTVTTGYADPYFGGPFGYGGWGHRGWGGYYGRSYYPGYYDPFLFGGSAYSTVEQYTVFTSKLELRIDRNDGTRMFEGTATAQSLSDKLTYLVPNLIDAMFTGFPGNSGESIQITVPPEKRK